MKWDQMTSLELGEVARATPVFLSIAAVEQHGPHLPLATDAMIGERLLGELDRRIGSDVLILPQLAVGASAHHLDYPGTLSLRHATLQSCVIDIAESVFGHGFRNLVIFNSHAGNQALGGVVLEQLGAAHLDRRIVLASWWKLIAPELRTLLARKAGGDSHAGDLETSLMLHLYPEAVRAIAPRHDERSAPFSWAAGDLLTAERATLYASMRDRTGGSGVDGEPGRASAERGAAITALVTEALTDLALGLKRTG
ncbi:creatininase family protein [Amorphus sp. MBR-141]